MTELFKLPELFPKLVKKEKSDVILTVHRR